MESGITGLATIPENGETSEESGRSTHSAENFESIGQVGEGRHRYHGGTPGHRGKHTIPEIPTGPLESLEIQNVAEELPNPTGISSEREVEDDTRRYHTYQSFDSAPPDDYDDLDFDYERANIPQLPPMHEFSINGILDAIQPEIEIIVDQIAEILGRSRYSLANEYGSHMPPQGEIRASIRALIESDLLPVEEDNEPISTDPIIIVGEDTSLTDGSHGAYDLLERIRATNAAQLERQRRAQLEEASRHSIGIPSPPSSVPSEPPELLGGGFTPRRPITNHLALLHGSGIASGRTNQATSLSPAALPAAATHLNVHETSRTLPLHHFEHTDMVDGPHSRLQNLSMIRDLQSLLSWLYQSADAQRLQREGAAAAAAAAAASSAHAPASAELAPDSRAMNNAEPPDTTSTAAPAATSTAVGVTSSNPPATTTAAQAAATTVAGGLANNGSAELTAADRLRAILQRGRLQVSQHLAGTTLPDQEHMDERLGPGQDIDREAEVSREGEGVGVPRSEAIDMYSADT